MESIWKEEGAAQKHDTASKKINQLKHKHYARLNEYCLIKVILMDTPGL
jgi:hypothetical protein